MDYTAPPPERVDKVTQEHLNEVLSTWLLIADENQNFVQYILVRRI